MAVIKLSSFYTCTIAPEVGKAQGSNSQAMHLKHFYSTTEHRNEHPTDPTQPIPFPFKPHYILRLVNALGMPWKLLLSERWNTYIAAIFLKMHTFFGIPHALMSLPHSCFEHRNFHKIHNACLKRLSQWLANWVSVLTCFLISLCNELPFDHWHAILTIQTKLET